MNWNVGEDVIIHPGVKDEEAERTFPGFRVVKPYLRYTTLSKEMVVSARV